VKNAAEDSVRQANFQAELAAWQVAQQEHADLMKIRHREKKAVWKAAQKGAKKGAPPPAARVLVIAFFAMGSAQDISGFLLGHSN